MRSGWAVPTSLVGSNPVRMSSDSAASRTVRAIGPACESVPNGLAGHNGTRPYVGLIVTVPVNAAGIRNEPPPSVPTDHAHAERDRGGTSAARSARGQRGIPRIAGGTVPRRVGHTFPAELRRRGLSQQSGSRFAQPGYRRRVVGPRAAFVDERAAAQCGPSAGRQEVLNRGRHAIAWPGRLARPPPGFGSRRRRDGGVRVDEDKGIDRVVAGVDRRQCRAGGLNRRHAPVGVRLDQLGGGQIRQVGHRSARSVIAEPAHAGVVLAIDD